MGKSINLGTALLCTLQVSAVAPSVNPEIFQEKIISDPGHSGEKAVCVGTNNW